ncbi:hypothetical protein H1D32_11970 [Anaerobacillus sp. CMMVII]|uniref:hypothetical protein n=1 Tax=Anaerobacillus sp. CMMVII TaxID=2755588 RepID=UPI0021B730B6|nr:hypothetical protein [Anaerobacillus sp. CMMVII]MCT8138402.1 hypothetical protein [Anaerobacillus sp. CMMVII]
MKKKLIPALSLILIVSLIFNYYFYKDNSSFKVRLGEEYQLATRYAIHYIDEPTLVSF